ncbi:MAG TPA: histidine phosphatase family protein [Luteimicrobium sp.]|nr:histidine phosphatase family protein [Luteimicrobium sp.]
MTTSPDPQLVLVRHGETAWSLSGQHTGTSDIPLTPHGEEQARASGVLLASRVAAGQHFRTVLTSPRSRARRTAELAGFGGAVVDGDLAEWDYGPVEGRTSAQISAETGTDWEIFRDGVHVVGPEHAAVPHPTAGETLDDVAARTARVVERVLPTLEAGASALVFAHGHVLRILATTWLGLPPTTGALLELGTASVSQLGFGHGIRTLEGWNQPSGA